MNHFFQKIQKYSLLLVIFVSFKHVNAADISINDNETKSTSADLNDNNSVEFTGTSTGSPQGQLTVDFDRILANITATNTGGVGNVNFTTANTLTVTGSIGSNSNVINQIVFDANGILNSAGDIYLQNGIITNTDNTGILTLNGGALQTIAAAIGTSAADQLSVLTIGSNGATFQIQRH